MIINNFVFFSVYAHVHLVQTEDKFHGGRKKGNKDFIEHNNVQQTT